MKPTDIHRMHERGMLKELESYFYIRFRGQRLTAVLRWPPKKKLIINRDVSGGYCKTAVIRWHGLLTTKFN